VQVTPFKLTGSPVSRCAKNIFSPASSMANGFTPPGKEVKCMAKAKKPAAKKKAPAKKKSKK